MGRTTHGRPTTALMVAGVSSGVGKTTLTLGLMAVFCREGLTVQGFKTGPDYIDPGFHSLVTGRPSVNLDPWMMREEATCARFYHYAQAVDLSIIEGVMGFYDGRDIFSETGSSAALAKLLHVPVVLVVDASGMARSAAAVVKGFQLFDPSAPICGVIFNRVGGARHYEMLAEVVEKECGLTACGYLAKDEGLKLAEQHLGLVPVLKPDSAWLKWQETLAEQVAQTIDVARLKNLSCFQPQSYLDIDDAGQGCQAAQDLPAPSTNSMRPSVESAKHPVKMALAYDEAFHFYYQDNLELLKKAGAELVPFSPMQDKALPQGTKGLYIGGGFPESYIEVLAQNQEMMAAIRRAIEKGMPVYAECGGYMLLSQEVVTVEGKTYPMAGIIPTRTIMGIRLAALGYREVEALKDNLLLKKGECARGHEFHYSRMELTGVFHEPDGAFKKPPRDSNEVFPWAYGPSSHQDVQKDQAAWRDGYACGHVLAAYTHLHFCSNPAMAEHLVKCVKGS